ncbi:hypothetical protein GCM10009117_17430 [Gangjinia marincola]|uniref:Chromosome partitioning protein ParA n=1 Tax=Gangjinia marincola TaxID=578463 RepID=A0ABN1MHI7_9FLAO
MTEQKNNNALKILIGILAIGLVVLGVLTVNFYNENKKVQQNLTQQKDDLESELSDMIVKYDEAIADNDAMDNELMAQRDRIATLLDSVQDMDATLDLLNRYKYEVGKLKKERNRLFAVVDSLGMQNDSLRVEIDSTNARLVERTMLSDSLQTKAQELGDKVAVASQVKVNSMSAQGVIVRNSGKIVETNNNSRVDKVRTCFTLLSNDLAESGDKELFVQIINPKQDLIGDKLTKVFEDAVINYSAVSRVFYENDNLDVCVLSNATEAELVEGKYTVNVFEGSRMVGTTSFTLK